MYPVREKVGHPSMLKRFLILTGWKKANFTVPILLCAASIAIGASSHKLSVHAGKSELIVTVPDGQFALTDQEITRYVQHGANAIVRYFGKFPMSRINIDLQPARGNDVVFGRTKPIDGATITMFIGRECAGATLEDDWTLTHEMTHVAFPARRKMTPIGWAKAWPFMLSR